jgi:hypothetical protein
LTEILINDDNARGFPSQRNGSLTQGILTGGAFRIFQHLMQGALPHVQHRLTREMACGDFLQRRLPLCTHWQTSAIIVARMVSSPDSF